MIDRTSPPEPDAPLQAQRRHEALLRAMAMEPAAEKMPEVLDDTKHVRPWLERVGARPAVKQGMALEPPRVPTNDGPRLARDRAW